MTRDASDIVRVGVVGGFLSCIDCALVGAALPSMRTDLGLSDGRLSLFVSLSVAGMMLASLGGRRVLQGLGRKGALRLAATCVIAGVGLIAAFGGRFPLLAAGRVLQGFGLGLVFLTVPVVLAESVPTGFRGRAVCLYQLMMPVGMVVGALLGGLLSNVFSAGLAWRTSCLASTVPAVLLLAVARVLPDPVGGSEAERKREEFMGLGLKAFAFGVLLPGLTQLMGMGLVLNYSVEMMRTAGFVGASANVADVLVRLVYAALTAAAYVVVDRVDRRVLMLTGCAGAALALAAAGFLVGQSVAFAAAVAAFVMFYAVGPGVCVWLVTPEVMPVRFRPLGMCLATFGGHVSSLALTAVFLPAVAAWGQGIVFLTLSGVAAAVCVLTATCLPETRGRSLM